MAQKIVLWASRVSWSLCWDHAGNTDDSYSCVLCDQNWGEKKKMPSFFRHRSCDRLQTLWNINFKNKCWTQNQLRICHTSQRQVRKKTLEEEEVTLRWNQDDHKKFRNAAVIEAWSRGETVVRSVYFHRTVPSPLYMSYADTETFLRGIALIIRYVLNLSDIEHIRFL